MSGPALSDGVPGLEGLHTLTPPSPWASFTLNDWMDPDTGLQKLWANYTAYTRLQEVTGIHDAPDQDNPVVSLNFQQGELPLPRYGRGRTITYSGMVYGQTMSAMRSWAAAMRAAALSALTNPSAWELSVAYDPTYDPTGLTFVSYGIPVGFTCDDQQGAGTLLPSPYQRAFDLTFRQSEGRWWVTSDVVTTGTARVASGDSAVLDMPGTAPGEPTITVYGTGSGSDSISLEATEAGWDMDLVLPSAMSDGDELVIDFLTRTVTYTPSEGSPTDYSGYIVWGDNSTTAWAEAGLNSGGGSLVLGTNTLTVTGDEWEASAAPAVW